MRRPAFLIFAFLLASCGVLQPAPPGGETPEQARDRRAKAPPPAYNLTGYPPAVRDGYVDGCESARKSAYGRKDEIRFPADAQYRMGWNDGYSICSRK
ncbi:MAG: hypothetical protein IPP91_14560 [Betaproteobacteria bacterium]|nr:hypothetical protein [Betaproteobacteria bacterium]